MTAPTPGPLDVRCMWCFVLAGMLCEKCDRERCPCQRVKSLAARIRAAAQKAREGKK